MQILLVDNPRILTVKNAKFSGYHFYMNLNIYGDFRFCISVATFKKTFSLIFPDWSPSRQKTSLTFPEFSCEAMNLIWFSNFPWFSKSVGTLYLATTNLQKLVYSLPFIFCSDIHNYGRVSPSTDKIQLFKSSRLLVLSLLCLVKTLLL